MTAPRFRLTGATGIHKGDRDYQQDQVCLMPHPRVKACVMAVLADGMGGRSGGRKASDQVIMTTKQLFERYNPTTDDATETLKQIVTEAHMVIRLTAISSEEEPHSTIAVFLINPDGSCFCAHAGDSRVYHFHGKQLISRTKDHSYVQSLVDRGELTDEQAQFHPQSNVLMGCLGSDKDPPVEIHTIPKLVAGDCLMACSDGLWHYFSDTELGSVLAALPAREASEFLIEKARSRARGGGDNLSLAIVKLDQPT